MPVNNAIGVAIGLAPPDFGPTAVRVPLDFSASLTQRYDALSGQGSANAKYGYQTAFIDNSQNAGPLTVTCDGTLFAYSVPPKSYAFLPIACPPGSLGITFAVSSVGAVVSAQLLDVPTPYVVWAAIAPDAPVIALLPNDDRAIVVAAGATTSATAGVWTSLFAPDPMCSGAVLYNLSTDTLLLRASENSVSANANGFFRVAPNSEFRWPIAPKRRWWIRALTMQSAPYEVARY